MIDETCIITFQSRILLVGPSHSGKSYFLGKLLKYEEAVFGTPFDSIVLFKTAPSADYLQWVASNERVTIEERTPSEVLEELLSQDKDQYPRALYLFEDYLTSNKTTDPRLVEYWTAASNHCNLSVAATGTIELFVFLLLTKRHLLFQRKYCLITSRVLETLPSNLPYLVCGLRFETEAN